MVKSKVYYRSIKFNNGTEIQLEKEEITVFVGSNNVGKSVALKNIYNASNPARSLPVNFKVIDSGELIMEGDFAELKDYLFKNFASKTDPDNHINFPLDTRGIAELEESWKNNSTGFLYWILLKYLSTEDRISHSNSVNSLDFDIESPSHPLHHLYLDDSLEEKVNTFFNQAFNMDLVVNRFSGNKIHVHVGDKPKISEGEDRMSRNYVSKIKELPFLSTQGDGMRSFTSILLEIYSNSNSILFIDEPEAFLHPPQARLLGRLIGSINIPRQVFISTHSSDFIKGLLEGKNEKIKIIRISREADKNIPNVLDKEGIKLFWKDPILRYSPIIDGLFHRNVFICESEGDCRFYFAIMNAVFEDDKRFYEISDTLFIASHGKAKMPYVVKALAIVKVPLFSICDFDIFNNISPLKELVEAHDGVWDLIEKPWNIFKKAIEQQKAQLNRKEATENLGKIIEGSNDENLSPKEIERLKEVLKNSSNWSFAKKGGISFVPKGESFKACSSVIDYMNSIGIFPLPIGELECYCKSIGGTKSQWLESVLLRDLKTDGELKEAREFITYLIHKILPEEVTDN